MSDWHLLAPDEDTRAFAEAARAQFAALPGPEAVRAAVKGTPDGSGWEALVAGGYLDIGLPDEVGGLGRLIDLVAVLEEAGRSLLPAPLLASSLAHQARAAAGLATTERGAPQGFAIVRGQVRDGCVTTQRAHVLGAAGAERLTLLIRNKNRAWVAVLASRADGVQTHEDQGIIDPSRPAPAVTMTDARAEQWREVAGEPAVTRVCIAADLVGTAAGALAGAIAHVLQRSQFGQPLGAFQAIKHQLADGYLAVEKARSLTYGAVLDPTGRNALLANAAAVEAAVQTSSRYVQLMGAMGVTLEADPHLFLRRAHHSAALFGGPDELYLAAARIERTP